MLSKSITSKAGRPFKFNWDVLGPQLVKAYKAGASTVVLAKTHGMRAQTIGRFLRRTGIMRTRRAALRMSIEQGRFQTAPKHPKTCGICAEEFQADSGGQKYCKRCIPDKTFASRYSSYGISKPYWDQLVHAQGGTCALCDEVPKHVDHDHHTNRVRGLLCVHCNLAMARVEKPRWTQRALRYLKKDTGFAVKMPARRTRHTSYT